MINDIVKVTIPLAAIKDEDTLIFLQAALVSRSASIDAVRGGFPVADLPHYDEHEGCLWLVWWHGKLEAVLRTKCDDEAANQALNYCKNTGSGFAQYDATDFSNKQYSKAPNGKTVTTKLLRLEKATVANLMGTGLTITFRVEDPYYEEKPKPKIEEQ